MERGIQLAKWERKCQQNNVNGKVPGEYSDEQGLFPSPLIIAAIIEIVGRPF